MPGKLFIRADADSRIGTGHVMRMLALAEAWKAAGGQCVFISAVLVAGIRETIKSQGFELAEIHALPGSIKDAEETRNIAVNGKNWCVLDGYQFLAEYQSVIKQGALQLLVVDDEAVQPSFYADAVLNQNSYAVDEMYSKSLRSGKILCGSRFALLRSEFKSVLGPKVIQPRAKRVLLTFGGSDPLNLTEYTAAALQGSKDLEIKAVIGPGFKKKIFYCSIECHFC